MRENARNYGTGKNYVVHASAMPNHVKVTHHFVLYNAYFSLSDTPLYASMFNTY